MLFHCPPALKLFLKLNNIQMRTLLLYIVLSATFFSTEAQILDGTLDVTGLPNFIQSFEDVIKEAGLDDSTLGFESEVDANLISFILDPVLIVPSSTVCTGNIFRYSLYMHTENSPQNVKISARTTSNSGFRFPASIPYDLLIIKPLGPRDLQPTNGGNYIEIPNDGTQAIKILEFVGCRTDIPIQFKIEASALAPAGVSNFNISYTIVGSVL